LPSHLFAEKFMHDSHSMKNASSGVAASPSANLVRTQIYLSGDWQERLTALARQTGQSTSSMIRLAINKWLDGGSRGTQVLNARKQRLAKLAGVWGRRLAPDAVDVRKLREGWSRRSGG